MAQHDKHSVGIYYKIFGSLMVLTIITVAVNRVHVGIGLAIIVALTIASFKASLVAGYFMHLLHESSQVYRVLILTAIFFAFLMLLPLWGLFSVPAGTQHRTPLTPAAPSTDVHH